MNKYVVGYLSQFDGELLLEEVEANSKLEAMLSYLEVSAEEFSTVEAVYNYAANCDAYIEAIQINKSRSGRPGTFALEVRLQ